MVMGTGSANIVVENSDDGIALFGDIFEGSMPLVDIQELQYNTYRTEDGDAQAVSLAFNLNYIGQNDWNGRLVFEPYFEGTLVTGEWQTWNSLTQGGQWATGAPGNE